MCRVDGGTFKYGGGQRLVHGVKKREQNVEATTATVRGFYIDQFEVTSAQAAVFLNAHGNSCNGLDKVQNPGEVNPCVWVASRFGGIEEKQGRFYAKKGREIWPEASFTWEGAMRYCAWAGKRVPSSAQWEYAARHDSPKQRDLIYPWGDHWRPHAAACDAPECDRHPHGPLPRDGSPPDPAYLPVGTFDGTNGRADGTSPWGLHDTAGGAAELVFECSDPDQSCEAGGDCDCRILTTSSIGAIDLSQMRTDFRVDDTAVGFGLVGVRCARIAQ